MCFAAARAVDDGVPASSTQSRSSLELLRLLGFEDAACAAASLFTETGSSSPIFLFSAQFFELHIELEDFFKQIGGTTCFFAAPDLRASSVAPSIALRDRRLEAQQVFGARDRVFQGAISVVELRSSFSRLQILLLRRWLAR